MRWILLIVVDRLPGLLDLGAGAQGQARVLVAGVAGEVAAGDLQPQPVAGLEHHARLPEADRVPVDPARLDRRRVLQRLAERDAADAFADVDRPAVRMHVASAWP